MQLICYRVDSDAPEIVPARQQREWMDAFSHRHPYRCLPMTIANAYGWELLSPCDFEAEWNGGPEKPDITIRSSSPRATRLARSHFGRGVLTFHTGYLFQTDPSWELVATGPTNEPKDGISCLTGVIETHWLPFPFTMNWHFTRPGVVRWSQGEPFCLVFPVARHAIEQTEPIIRSIDANPGLKEQYVAWRDSRGEFLENLRARDVEVVKEGWQRHYFRGERVADGAEAEGHMQKLRPAKPIDEDPQPKDSETESREKPPRKRGPSKVARRTVSATGKSNSIAETVRKPAGARFVHTAESGRRPDDDVGPATREMSYLICTTPRSGSTLLAEGLESTGVAGIPKEYFDLKHEPSWRQRLKIQRDDEYLPNIRRGGSTSNGVFAAKVLYFQFDNLKKYLGTFHRDFDADSPEAISAAFGPVKFIWLRREDKTLQAISWDRAAKTDDWFRIGNRRPAGSESLVFDAAKIAMLKAELCGFDEQWRLYFERHKIPVLELVYEDFAHEYEETIIRTLEFLDPPQWRRAKPPIARLKRQADDLTFDWLHRFAMEFPEELVRTRMSRRRADKFNREGARYFQRGDFIAAESCLRRALEWDALSVHALQNLGSTLASQGKLEQALPYFHRALIRSSDSAEICRNLALTYERCGHFNDAERFYLRAAELDPKSQDWSRHLARIADQRLKSESPKSV